ncbi:MAG: endonuclease/exonuclease/phosphatase family protein [Deltaproteobacteria bacterium]|nr:endonuclease/exonuclease/phosphatase family protein [Deltaproteobacteria bacterium]
MGVPESLFQSAARRLRVATWNLQSCRRGLTRVAQLLRGLEVDAVALQEVDRRSTRSGGVDQAAALASAAGFAHHRFFGAVDWDGGDYGLALLSRWPLGSVRTGLLPNEPGLEPRIHGSAVLELPGAPVFLHVTHLTNTRARLRLQQAGTIAHRLSRSDLPQVLLGDFNAFPDSAPHHLLCRLLVDAFRAAGEGPGGTYPLPLFLPTVRIDYVFVAREVSVTSARVVHTDASDHHALVADLRVPEDVSPTLVSQRAG